MVCGNLNESAAMIFEKKPCTPWWPLIIRINGERLYAIPLGRASVAGSYQAIRCSFGKEEKRSSEHREDLEGLIVGMVLL